VARELNSGVRILALVNSTEEASMLSRSLHIEVMSPQQAMAERMATWAASGPVAARG
jgi:Trk K+ transport system NAD-binding subunit